ncbi:MAG: 2-C-methyl-D-erythritol 2,4-cyclodiphosphate synthase [Conexibacter sp.]
MAVATGIGWDVHRLVAGRPLVLGGVAVPSELGLDGHSDADVLTHAVIDALLGAAGLGDIGEHFPDTDERWRGADSLELLRHVAGLLRERGANVGNVDVTVAIEQPRLLEHKPAMAANIAAALAIPAGRVNVKATRGEGLGFLGRVEGAAALAVATIEAPGAR